METAYTRASDDVKKAYIIIADHIGYDKDAVQFIELYAEYCHAIDDIIDEPLNPELILKTFSMATSLYSMPFWIKHHQSLLITDYLVNNQYADVVSWEKSNDDWKRRHAQALSHAAYNMLFAVLLLVAGRDVLRQVSEKFRTFSHLKHLSH